MAGNCQRLMLTRKNRVFKSSVNFKLICLHIHINNDKASWKN